MSMTCPSCGAEVAGALPRECAKCGNVVQEGRADAQFTAEEPDLRAVTLEHGDVPSDRDAELPSIVNPSSAVSSNTVALIVVLSILLCGSQGATAHPAWPGVEALKSQQAMFGFGVGLFVGLAIAWDYTRWINRPASLSGLDSALSERTNPPSEALSYLMLALTLLAGLMSFLGKSIGLVEAHIAWIGSATVLTTAILAYFNMKQMALRNLRETEPQSAWNGPVFAYLGLLGFWLICFPAHFFIRRRMGAKNLIFPALIATAVYLSPIAQMLLTEPTLPSADDAEVVSLVKQLLEDEPMMKPVAVAEPTETAYDEEKQVRMCRCTITTKFGAEVVPYRIDWQDRNQGRWQVFILDRLPIVHAPEVMGLLQNIVENEWIGKGNRVDLAPIHVHQPVQTAYDAVRQQRAASATVRTQKGDVPITFTVEWVPPDRKLFRIQMVGNPP